MANIGIIGAGAWGTALAIHAAKLDHDVALWSFEPALAASITNNRINDLYLPDFKLPYRITGTSDLGEACREKDFVLFACPSKHMRRIATEAAPSIAGDAIIGVASKGIEASTNSLMTEVLDSAIPQVPPMNFVVLSGPTFAKEVAEGLPADIVAASAGFIAARKIQPMFHTPVFRVYTSDDPVGVQIGAALKNVIAVAAGVCDELGLGLNARAALITRGLTEMTRLGIAKGANPITFLGLAGIGDLILTCTGDLSRNRTLGRRIARGEKPEEILASTRTVAEGFFAADSALKLAASLDVDMPITQQVYAVLYEGKTIADAARELMSREFKNEFKGIIHA
jgi:glycerol-3-phosphate dehydrogenase (NAD(P)+)